MTQWQYYGLFLAISDFHFLTRKKKQKTKKNAGQQIFFFTCNKCIHGNE